ncbi:hypothetical protein EX30DRAFT_368175 [Ascodesmis nigricans]|uniref:Photolyase/cryptochrome alpha/beta domain-containing protein n=1 Tax=Ascodesmis nigricans TaxID=341454 RepID=A0A4S2N6U8_9PEZI|nr:hypothetical protein EX30DRAFT_368175 [Ascodesmis nigricans]
MPPKRKTATLSEGTPGKKLRQTTLTSSARLETAPKGGKEEKEVDFSASDESASDVGVDSAPDGQTFPRKIKRKKSESLWKIAAARRKVLRDREDNRFAKPKPWAKLPDVGETDYDDTLVNRKYYPPVITNANCTAYADGAKSVPFAVLEQTLKETAGARAAVETGRCVVHWFRTDLRMDDNTALSAASTLAAAKTAAGEDCSVIGLFVISPQDYEAHLMSPARMDFMLRSLKKLKKNLQKLEIPIWVETVEKRRDVVGRVLELVEKWGGKHVFANMEYEVDELRRDEKLILQGIERGISVELRQDTCVVPPGTLFSQASGKPYSVYTPWFKTWLKYLRENPYLLDLPAAPSANPRSTATTFADLFCQPSPTNPLPLSEELRETQLTLFPAGSRAAHQRLQHFITQHLPTYHKNRNNLTSNPPTSVLSPHLSTGTISARTCISHAYLANKNSLTSDPPNGPSVWISELAWRDFYRHILVSSPWVCMNKPFKPHFASIPWPHSPRKSAALLDAWITGQTGFPLVDAAMRQLAAQCWIPNRMRMVVASFLAKDMMVDWRLGEQYFMRTLVDADFASNSGGWGWASGTGADAQPWFRIFNPQRQMCEWDPKEEYVRRWVPELGRLDQGQIVSGKGLQGEKARRRLKYPEECVVHGDARKKAAEIYKTGLEKGKTAP